MTDNQYTMHNAGAGNEGLGNNFVGYVARTQSGC